jgi:hypothetical protein
MKANELRLNNYYQLKGAVLGGGICRIGTIQDFEKIYELMYSNSVSPIPLTEEWLLNFGFEKVVYDSEQTGYGTEYHFKVNSDIFMNYSDDFSLAIYANKKAMEDELGVIPKWEVVKNVHQLQNLYYALIGEELKLKEVENE